jgi:RimJ/RimL family protein N-acetyltransferase
MNDSEVKSSDLVGVDAPVLSVQPPIPLQKGYYLSPIVRTDKAAYLQHYNADDSITRNLLVVPYPYTEEHADWWLTKREQEARNPETFFAIRRGEDGFLIGAIGTGYEPGKTNMADPYLGHSAEFGYWLSVEYRGLGLMPAVIQAFAKHCFTNLGIHRLQASIFSFNEASGKALIKAGFTKEGCLRHYYKKNGQYLDAISYSLLSDDALPDVVVKDVA